MAIIGSIFKGAQKRPRGLKYKPMYYDPQKEELQQRIDAINKKYEGLDKESAIRQAEMQLRIDKMRKQTITQDNGRQQLLRLGIIVMVLLAIMYYILYIFDFTK